MISQSALQSERDYLQYVLSEIRKHHENCHARRQSIRENKPNNDYSDIARWNWSVHNTDQTIQNLAKMQDNPYFGRIDFYETELPNPEVIYIGRFSLYADDEHLIFDWRAPICSMFYSHDIGTAAYEAPIGIVNGTIRLKRQYEIKCGTIIRIYGAALDKEEYEPLQVNDDILLSILSGSASMQMRQIVRSIQAEQNTAIRHNSDVLLIHGPAGSGKTIIALHRAAYLLYQMRSQQILAIGSQMLVISPNKVFSNYISNVLPELGEQQVRQRVFGDYVKSELAAIIGRRWRIECKTEQGESFMSQIVGSGSRSRAIRFKSSAVMVALIQELASDSYKQFTSQLDDLYYPESANGGNDDLLMSSSRLHDQFHRLRRSTSAALAAEEIRKLVRDEVNSILDNPRVALRPGVKRELQGYLRRITAAVERTKRIDIVALYSSIWKDMGRFTSVTEAYDNSTDIQDICRLTTDNLRCGVVCYEDAVCLLLLYGLLVKPSRLHDIRHVIVDEAQDYSLPEYSLLKMWVSVNSGYTLVGDFNQATTDAGSIQSYDELVSLFGQANQLILSRSYRSSSEITRFTSSILGPKTQIHNVRRSGRKPVVVSVRAPADLELVIVERVGDLLKRNNSVAVICKSIDDCSSVYTALKNHYPATLITKDSEGLCQGVLVFPIHTIKGLEFDAVVVHNAGKEYYSGESDKRLLYTVCTRALHELCILHTGEVTNLIPPKSADLYECTTADGSFAGLLNEILDNIQDLDVVRIRGIMPYNIATTTANEIRAVVKTQFHKYTDNPTLYVMWCLAEMFCHQTDEDGILSIYRMAIKLYGDLRQDALSKNATEALIYCIDIARLRQYDALSTRMAAAFLRAAGDSLGKSEILRFSPSDMKVEIAWSMLADLNEHLNRWLGNERSKK